MGRRKKDNGPRVPRPDDLWVITTEMQINGRYVTKGTELKIQGQRGRFRFIKHVKTEADIEWIDVWGGPKGAESIRSFRPDLIKTVHYKNKTDHNLAIAYKQKQKDKKQETTEEDSEE